MDVRNSFGGWWAGWALALVGVGCSSSPTILGEDEPPMGQLSLQLVTSEQPPYRLREALFDIETRTGSLLATLDSEQDPAAPAVSVPLPVGEYVVRLHDGWALEQVGEEPALGVHAALLTRNPTEFEIVDAHVTEIVYAFALSEARVALATGDLEVGFEVRSSASLPSCDLRGYDCQYGLTCLLADETGRTFCAQPGSLPVGSPCDTEQCVFGAQCLSLDAAQPEARSCTEFCSSYDPPFGCNCVSLGLEQDIGVCGPLPEGACTLLDADACDPGQACQYLDGNWGVCGAPGPLSEGEACVSGSDCAAGLRCYFDDPGFEGGRCRRNCRTEAPLEDNGCDNRYCSFVGTGNAGVCSD